MDKAEGRVDTLFYTADRSRASLAPFGMLDSFDNCCCVVLTIVERRIPPPPPLIMSAPSFSKLEGVVYMYLAIYMYCLSGTICHKIEIG